MTIRFIAWVNMTPNRGTPLRLVPHLSPVSSTPLAGLYILRRDSSVRGVCRRAGCTFSNYLTKTSCNVAPEKERLQILPLSISGKYSFPDSCTDVGKNSPIFGNHAYLLGHSILTSSILDIYLFGIGLPKKYSPVSFLFFSYSCGILQSSYCLLV